MTRTLLAACAALSLALLSTPDAHAARLLLINEDSGTGVGLDDPTPALPVGGNPGRTVGEQRRIAYEYALAQWGAVLTSPVDIEVSASFAPMACSANSGVLGGAGATQYFNNFTGARPAVMYPGALANAMAGRRLDDTPGGSDISTTFNGRIGTPGCLERLSWYLGLDGKGPGGTSNFLNVIMHELAHGLGAAGLVDVGNGALGLGRGLTDSYTRHTVDITTDLPLDSRWTTDQQRARMLTSPGRVVWNGAAVRREAALVLDRDPRGYLVGADVRGRPQLYTPATLQRGSTFSHFDTALSPNALMEPAISADLKAHITLDLTPAMFTDIGWKLNRGNARLEGCDTRIPIVEEGGLIPGANLLAHEKLCLAAHSGDAAGRRSCIINHARSMNALAVISSTQLNRVQSCLMSSR